MGFTWTKGTETTAEAQKRIGTEVPFLLFFIFLLSKEYNFD